MQGAGAAAVYHPRNSQQSPLWTLLNEHAHDYELNYDELCMHQYGYRAWP